MEFYVYDTYVKAKNGGHTMHFDVITDKKDDTGQAAIGYAKEWLATIGQEGSKVTTKECKFCHTETVSDEVEIEIMTNGYHIVKMEGCPV